jgi:hypothetical protein
MDQILDHDYRHKALTRFAGRGNMASDVREVGSDQMIAS